MKYLAILFCIYLIGCEEHKYYTISSPDKTKCLTIVEVTAMQPEFKSYAKIYYGAGAINKVEFIKMQWNKVSGFAVNWKAVPIIITNGFILENTMPNKLIEYKAEMNPNDDSAFHKPGSFWRSYDFELLNKGEYEKCK